MTIEYLPVGIACNLSCSYCYQDPMREAGNINVPRDWSKVKKVLEQLGSSFAVFGGEPLLAPIEHLEEVWRFGFERFGSNGIQTNGVLISDAHIDLFERYRVGVGISIDGPAGLNKARCSDEETERVEVAIRKLVARNIIPSLIVTIHRANSDLDTLLHWLDGLAVQNVNFHNLEIDCGREELALSEVESIEIFSVLYEWSKTTTKRVEPFCDIKKLLTERHPNVSCVWNACDPLTTSAVQGVGPDGSRSNCGRTNKDGVNWVKADEAGMERTLLLYQTPQEYGGCKGCKYFAFCKGQCPGTAIDGDWRNRTRDCRLWYHLFQMIEKDVPHPLDGSIYDCSGDFHGDSPHKDVPHGDAHGDHTDTTRVPGVYIPDGLPAARVLKNSMGQQRPEVYLGIQNPEDQRCLD